VLSIDIRSLCRWRTAVRPLGARFILSEASFTQRWGKALVLKGTSDVSALNFAHIFNPRYVHVLSAQTTETQTAPSEASRKRTYPHRVQAGSCTLTNAVKK
jgi:hypothetical protein